MVTIKLDDLEIVDLISACNSAISYYDNIIANTPNFIAKGAIEDFIEAKKKYQRTANKLRAALLQEDSENVN